MVSAIINTAWCFSYGESRTPGRLLSVKFVELRRPDLVPPGNTHTTISGRRGHLVRLQGIRVVSPMATNTVASLQEYVRNM